MPIGSGAVFAAANLPRTFTDIENELVIMAPTAPLRPLWDNGQWWPGAACSASGTSAGLVPVPDAYVVPAPPSGGDGTLPNRAGGVLLPDGRTIQEFQYATRCSSTGPLTTGAVRCTLDIYGSGTGCFAAHGGSGLSGVGGSLRAWEVSGAGPITHALKLTLPAATLSNCGSGFRWPALAADSGFNVSGSSSFYSGGQCALQMGSLLAIGPSLNCNTLVSSVLAQRVCVALQDYGAYVVDTAPQGYNAMVLIGEWGTANALSAISSDLLTLFTQLSVVTNNGPSSIGGGGTPLAPLAPPIGN